MNFGALFIGGVVGSAETSVLSILAAEYFSRQIMDTLGLLMFFVTVPAGALLGTALAAAIVRLENSPKGQSSFVGGWFLATIVGFPVSWMAAMMFSFGPSEIILSMFAVQLIGLFILTGVLFRSQRNKP